MARARRRRRRNKGFGVGLPMKRSDLLMIKRAIREGWLDNRDPNIRAAILLDVKKDLETTKGVRSCLGGVEVVIEAAMRNLYLTNRIDGNSPTG